MKEWFDNKSIAIIGNAKSLFDKNYGAEIDSHDVVIRINKGIEICTKPKDYKTHGNKVDIWCFNLYRSLENFDNDMKKQIPQKYKRLQMNYNPDTSKFDSSISESVLNEIKNMFAPKKITTGFRILHYITKFNPKSVDVYGFDWKETPTYYINYKSNADQGHDYKKEKEYCFKHYFNTSKFTLKV
jgi:hypothetical protein